MTAYSIYFHPLKMMQARVVHNSSIEWQQIKDATEKARDGAAASGDEVGELTCSELLEALELSRCFFLMKYEHHSVPFIFYLLFRIHLHPIFHVAVMYMAHLYLRAQKHFRRGRQLQRLQQPLAEF